MNALELLHKDHEAMKRLLDEATEETNASRREELLATIRAELAAHELIEEEILYPRLQQHAPAKDIVLEGYEEHHLADVILEELMEASSGSDVWKAKMKVLKESLEHHIEEEEGEMFDKARELLSREELDELGSRMRAAKEEGGPVAQDRATARRAD